MQSKILSFFFDKLQIVETRGAVQLGKWNDLKQEKLYNYESKKGEEEDILQESSCI